MVETETKLSCFFFFLGGGVISSGMSRHVALHCIPSWGVVKGDVRATGPTPYWMSHSQLSSLFACVVFSGSWTRDSLFQTVVKTADCQQVSQSRGSVGFGGVGTSRVHQRQRYRGTNLAVIMPRAMMNQTLFVSSQLCVFSFQGVIEHIRTEQCEKFDVSEFSFNVNGLAFAVPKSDPFLDEINIQ